MYIISQPYVEPLWGQLLKPNLTLKFYKHKFLLIKIILSKPYKKII